MRTLPIFIVEVLGSWSFASFFSSRAILIVRLRFLTGLYMYFSSSLYKSDFEISENQTKTMPNISVLLNLLRLCPTITINDQKFSVCLTCDYIKNHWNACIILFLISGFSSSSQVDLLYFFTVICLLQLIIFEFTSNTWLSFYVISILLQWLLRFYM